MTVNKRHLVLIGFSGSGKSTIGPALAKKLDYEFIDTDEQIVKNEHKTIAKIFETKGERYFRKIEAEMVLKALQRKKKFVIALGGGAFQNASNRKLIEENAIVIFLSTAQKELYRRLRKTTDRPILSHTTVKLHDKIKTVLNQRINNYKKADIIVSTTDKTISQIVTLISKKLKDAEY